MPALPAQLLQLLHSFALSQECSRVSEFLVALAWVGYLCVATLDSQALIDLHSCGHGSEYS